MHSSVALSRVAAVNEEVGVPNLEDEPLPVPSVHCRSRDGLKTIKRVYRYLVTTINSQSSAPVSNGHYLPQT